MELLEGIATRRSFRAFKSDPIPKETMERILEAAGAALCQVLLLCSTVITTFPRACPSSEYR